MTSAATKSTSHDCDYFS